MELRRAIIVNLALGVKLIFKNYEANSHFSRSLTVNRGYNTLWNVWCNVGNSDNSLSYILGLFIFSFIDFNFRDIVVDP